MAAEAAAAAVVTVGSRLMFPAALMSSMTVYPDVMVQVEVRESFSWERFWICVSNMGRGVSTSLGKAASSDTRKAFIRLATQKANALMDRVPEESRDFNRLRVALGKRSRAFMFNVKDELYVLSTVSHGAFLFTRGMNGTVSCVLYVQPTPGTYTGHFSFITSATLCLLHGVTQLFGACFADTYPRHLSVTTPDVPADVMAAIGEFQKTFVRMITAGPCAPDTGDGDDGTCAAPAVFAEPIAAADAEVVVYGTAPAAPKKRKRTIHAAVVPLPALAQWHFDVLEDIATFVRDLGWSADDIGAAAAHVARMTPVCSYPALAAAPGTPRLDAAAEAALLLLLQVAQNAHFTHADLAVWRRLRGGVPLV